MPYKIKQDRYRKHVEYREKNFQKMWEILCNSQCQDCGIKDPRVLQFDHLPEHKKEFGVAAAIARQTFSWTKIQKEIDKCQILCANCHMIKTAERGNHKRHTALIA